MEVSNEANPHNIRNDEDFYWTILVMKQCHMFNTIGCGIKHWNLEGIMT